MTNRLQHSRMGPLEKTTLEKLHELCGPARQARDYATSLDDIAGSAPQDPVHADLVERVYHVPDLLVYITEGQYAELYKVTFSRTSDGNPKVIAGNPDSIKTKETMLDVKGEVIFETLSATDGKFDYDDNFRETFKRYASQNKLAAYGASKTDSALSSDDMLDNVIQMHYNFYMQLISKAQSGDKSSQPMHQGIDAHDADKQGSKTPKSASETLTPYSGTSLADRIKQNPAKQSKDGSPLTDLYVNIRGKHYFFEFTKFPDGTPFMYEDEITGLVMPMGMFYEMTEKDTKLLLGEKVYAHIKNRQPDAGTDFDFYLELEKLNENPELSILVIGDEHSTDTEILKRELYSHLRRYRDDVIAASSAPKKADQVIADGNPLSIYNPSTGNGFDWHKDPKFDWKAAWK